MLVLAAILMVVMMAMLAFSVDIGYMFSLQTDLKRSTDAAALAGAGVLVDGPEVAELQAFEFYVRNPVGARCLAKEEGWEDQLAALYAQHGEDCSIQMGHWDPGAVDDPQTPHDDRFSIHDPSAPGANPPSAIRVQAYYRDVPFFFGNLFRKYEYVLDETGLHHRAVPIDLNSESIARYQPRDIMLVLDFSASMNDDSELTQLSQVPAAEKEATRAIVEANLELIDSELLAIPSPPNCGDLPFQPAWPVMHGQPASGEIPHCTVQFGTDADGYKSIHVTSTKDLSNVVIQTSDGYQQKFDGLSGYSKSFKGTATNTKNKQIVRVWVKSGSNSSTDGTGFGERFDCTTATIKKAFGLDTVAYPYPSGSWDTYISYANDSSVVNTAGYRRKYGRMTLINYWLEQKPRYQETPDLWRVSAQPAKALKDGVGVFMQYIREVDTSDRMGLAIYNSPNVTALLEHGLTYEFECVGTTTAQRQAGHYDQYTNIGAGIKVGREELEAKGRTGAFKMIVLMTDGRANRPSNESTARAFALSEAQLVANKRWPIITISLGNGADTALMEQIASMTNGAHFNVPGGESITDYTPALLNVFRRIADHRPLTLVK
jgi:hypothetical protein